MRTPASRRAQPTRAFSVKRGKWLKPKQDEKHAVRGHGAKKPPIGDAAPSAAFVDDGGSSISRPKPKAKQQRDASAGGSKASGDGGSELGGL